MKLISLITSFLGTAIAFAAAGLEFSDIIDPYSILIVALPVLGSGIFVAGPYLFWKAVLNIFTKSTILSNNRGKIKKTYAAMGHTAMGAGIIGFFIGIVGMVKNIPSLGLVSLGRGLAASAIVLVYGLLLKYLVFIPAEKATEVE